MRCTSMVCTLAVVLALAASAQAHGAKADIPRVSATLVR